MDRRREWRGIAAWRRKLCLVNKFIEDEKELGASGKGGGWNMNGEKGRQKEGKKSKGI